MCRELNKKYAEEEGDEAEGEEGRAGTEHAVGC